MVDQAVERRDPKARQEGSEPKTILEEVHEATNYTVDDMRSVLNNILESATAWPLKAGSWRLQDLPSLQRFLALSALILWGRVAPRT